MKENPSTHDNKLEISELIHDFGQFLDSYNQYMYENDNYPNLHQELESILEKLQVALNKTGKI